MGKLKLGSVPRIAITSCPLPTAKEETRAVPLKPEALSWIKPTTEEKREEIAPQKQVADDKYREPIE